MTGKRLEFIDFAKGFAILSIVAFHYCQPYATGLAAKAIMVGGTGVHLFFILSGFGLAMSSAKLHAADFYRNRLLKILLPYYFVVLCIYLANHMVEIYSDSSLYALGGHVFLYKMFDERITGSYGYHFWFISTIVQLYFAFPLIVKLRRLMSATRFIGLAALISMIYWWATSFFGVADTRVFGSFCLQYLWEFALGMVLAERHMQRQEELWGMRKAGLLALAVGGLGLMAVMALKWGAVGKAFNDLPASIGYMATAALAYRMTTTWAPAKNAVVFVGKVSYELYLLHVCVFLFANHMMSEWLHFKPNIFSALLLVFPLALWLATGYSKQVQMALGKLTVTPR